MEKLKLKQIIKNIKESIQNVEIRNCSKLDSLATSQLSKTLSFMFEAFFDMKQYKFAKLAAFWSLRKSLKFNRSFLSMSRSFTNVFKILASSGAVEDFYWLIEAAPGQTTRALFIDDLHLHALTEVVKMYSGLMMCQYFYLYGSSVAFSLIFFSTSG